MVLRQGADPGVADPDAVAGAGRDVHYLNVPVSGPGTRAATRCSGTGLRDRFIRLAGSVPSCPGIDFGTARTQLQSYIISRYVIGDPPERRVQSRQSGDVQVGWSGRTGMMFCRGDGSSRVIKIPGPMPALVPAQVRTTKRATRFGLTEPAGRRSR